ncbi:MAG TPA: DUF711 family protein [Acidimicrobiales bacterium]|nr:DUF711 family protein [Acidimicrobiales bacterium]
MRKPPVRALTLGVAEPHPLDAAGVQKAADKLRLAADTFGQSGYEVQTLRLSTRPVLSDLAGWVPDAIALYAGDLQEALAAAGVEFCSLGPARRGTPPDRIIGLADLIVGREALNCSVMVATPGAGIDVLTARAAAEVMLRLASETKEGFGNFNFAALACVGPGTPFFPAAYHAGPANLTVALQGAGILAEGLQAGAGLADVTRQVREALVRQASPVVELAQQLASGLGVYFGGIDLSPAPDGDDSIAAAIELAGLGPFGSPGTLALAAAITPAIQSTGLPTCGYCGLMLPVMEDAVLAERWAEGRVGLDQLLAYSAVCGTGLDTVPLPGDCSADELANVICDVASLAVRLRKPLSARLLPVPGKRAGEVTEFSSPYLVNTLIKPLG